MEYGLPFGSSDMPEEVRERLKVDLEMQRMAAEQQNDAFLRFIGNLDEEGLRLVRGLLRTAVSDHEQGFFMVGYFTSELANRYNVCTFCQEKHPHE